MGYDLLATGHNLRWAIEIKYYRTGLAHAGLLDAAAVRLIVATRDQPDTKPMLVVSSFVPQRIRGRLDQIGVAVTDRDDLVFEATRVGLFDQLTAIIETGSQVKAESAGIPGADEAPIPTPSPAPDIQGSQFCAELVAMKRGKQHWKAYEALCERILKYLFGDDLYGWHKQKRTDDGLNRFDIVCRIMPTREFWRFLLEHLHSRYALFEFKNYQSRIKQGQVLTTEKYLLENGLRRFALMLTRAGADAGATATVQARCVSTVS